jgi:septal ring factor EnvC (AmiA/AmiB activator)
MRDWRLRWVGIGLIVWLNGCAAPAPVISPAPVAAVQRDEIQNSLERQMVILFQSLLQMDRRDNLKLSTQQAEAMLPLVERNTRVGELEQADKQLIINLLSAEQKDFTNEFQDRIRAKEQALKEYKKKESSSVEERETMIHEFEARRRDRDAERQTAPTESGSNEGNPGSPPGGGSGSGKNVEQQLIDLLGSKLKASKEVNKDSSVER